MAIHDADCPLVPKLLREPGRCDLATCGKPLPPRRSRWCSDACARAFHEAILEQHDWSTARAAALRRDGERCVKCGANGLGPAEEIAAVWRSWEAAIATAASPSARRELVDEAVRAVRGVDRACQLEVNHIVPMAGRRIRGRRVSHSTSGCWHHLDNLETLCAECHAKVTADQARARAQARRGAAA